MATRKDYAKKLTTKTVGLTPEKCEEIAKGQGSKAIPVVRVYGTVKKAEPKQSDLGPYSFFHGQFEAVNLVDGHKVRSTSLIVPAVAEPLLNDALAGEKEANGDAATLTFGLDITVLENLSQKGGWKFKFGVTALKGSEQKDPLDMLGEQLGTLPLLESKSKK